MPAPLFNTSQVRPLKEYRRILVRRPTSPDSANTLTLELNQHCHHYQPDGQERVVPTRTRVVLEASPQATLTDLLNTSLTLYGVEDTNHLSQFVLRHDRTKATPGTWPIRDADTRIPICDWYPGTDTWSTEGGRTLSSLLGVGDVGYVWFDYGDDWFFEVRAVRGTDRSLPASSADPAWLTALYGAPSVRELLR